MPNFSKARRRSLLISFVVVLSLLAIACGGDSGTSSSQSQSTSNATTPPSSTATTSGSTETSADAVATPPAIAKFELDSDSGQAPFTPVITNLSENSDSFTWDFGDGSDSSSSESPSHPYTKSGSFVLELTVGDGEGSAKFTQTITVEPGPLAILQITPSEVAVPADESFKFSAEGFDEFGNAIENVDFAWTASEDAGSIDSTGLFNAATTAGEYSNSVTVNSDDGAHQASINVIVEPGPPISITLNPADLVLDIGASQEIILEATDEFGNEISNPLSSWKVAAEVGSIDGNGVVIAGTKAGVYPEGIRVDVVSGTTALSATVFLEVVAGPLASIDVLPAFPVVKKNETLSLKATGLDQYGNAIRHLAFLWNSDNLSVDSTGKVSIENQVGVHQVTVHASYRGSEQSALVEVYISSQWIPLENLSARRSNHTATLLKDGNVLIVGGDSSSRTAEIYDPVTRTFSKTGNTGSNRSEHTATLLLDGRVLIVGAACSDVRAELYDPSSRTFSFTKGSLEQGRVAHTATTLNDGKVLIAGGYCRGDRTQEIGSAEIFDPSTGAFTRTKGDLVIPRKLHDAALLPNGEVLLVRGWNSDITRFCVDTLEIYDPISSTFREAELNIRYGGCANDRQIMTTLADGRLLITHGAERMEIYEPASGDLISADTWNQRYAHTTTTLQSGLVLIAGGHPGSTGIYDTTDLYDPIAGEIVSTNKMISPRISSTATLLLTGEVLLTGGQIRDADNVYSTLRSAELFLP